MPTGTELGKNENTFGNKDDLKHKDYFKNEDGLKKECGKKKIKSVLYIGFLGGVLRESFFNSNC